jgi:hypothetical protein
MQPLVERCPNGEDTTARTCAGFQDDDRYAGLVKKIGCAQAGETGADDHNRLVGIERMRGIASNGSRGERQSTRHLLKKSSSIHVLIPAPTELRPHRSRAKNDAAPSVSGYRQAGCWQSQRSSVDCPFSLQCSLQYLPYGPLGDTMH